MASLQKIRNHGALLIVIVGVAMLAFILGDFLRDGSSLIHRDRDKVGIVAGEALSYAEYEAEIKRIESFYPDAQKHGGCVQKELSIDNCFCQSESHHF